MNNGADKVTQNARAAGSTRSRRPALEVKFTTSDSINALVASNISGVKSNETALEYAAKVGLFSQGDSNDPEALGEKLLYGMLLAARRIQENTQDRPAQDAIWAIRFIFGAIHETWRVQTKTLREQNKALHEQAASLREQAKVLNAELNAAKKEAEDLKGSRWGDEPTLNTNDIAAAVMTRVQGVLQAHFTSYQKATAADTSKIDTLHQRLSILDTTVKDVAKAVESVTAALAAKPTYAAVTTGAPVHHDKYAGRTHSEQDALARTELQDRRLLIIADDSLQNGWLENTMPQLIAKAAMGVEKAFKGCPPPPALKDLDSVTPRHAFRAGKSGVVYSFDSRAVIDWLLTPDVWQQFASQFEGRIRPRPRLYEVLLRNVPLTLDPTTPSFLATLNNENSLPAGWIDNIRWMKPAIRRADTQRSAHAMMALRSADAANDILDRGILTYEGSTYRVERLLRDSPRCAKCQRHGHFANKCRRELTCGRCAGAGHQANGCQAVNPKCATCSDSPDCDADHPAWARECPARLRALEKLQNSNPEDFLPRFLTDKTSGTAFARQTVPLENITPHRPPAAASGAHKFHKPAEVPDKARKRASKSAATPATASRPATPVDGPKRGRRSRAASTASNATEASGASGTSKKSTNKKRKSTESVSSVRDVEDVLSTQLTDN